MKTLAECKDEVARKYNKQYLVPYVDWYDMQSMLSGRSIDAIISRMEEAAELYASQFIPESNHPDEWNATPREIKDGWKNKPKILSEITSAINEDVYIEDESEFMEAVDAMLEYLKTKYKISPISQGDKQPTK